jgi:nucleoside-diphosphate-sugar epimerase
MALLVTGAMGHVGYEVVVQAARMGLPVVAQAHRSFDAAAAERAGDGVTWVRCDLADPFEVAALAAEHRIEGCIHSAALPNDKVARPVPMSAFATNTAATQHLLELARRGGWRRMVFVSSGAVFQRWTDLDRAIPESEPATPINVYGTTKHCAELLVAMYREIYGVSAATVRVSWIYGPPMVPKVFEGPRGPIPEFLRRALRGEVVDEPSGGDFAASFTHVADCAAGLIALYRADTLAHPVYHLGSGENYPTSRVARAVAAAVPGSRVSVGPGTEPWTRFTVMRGPLSCQRMKDELGFSPAHTLESGVAQFAEWMRAHPESLT